MQNGKVHTCKIEWDATQKIQEDAKLTDVYTIDSRIRNREHTTLKTYKDCVKMPNRQEGIRYSQNEDIGKGLNKQKKMILLSSGKFAIHVRQY